MAQKRAIPRATRQGILDALNLEGVAWSGRLPESDFLARIWDIDALPSHDGRFSTAAQDIWQHRVNNPEDWDDDWIYGDPRFNLVGCDDELFLAETVHPTVRRDPDEVERLVRVYNEALAPHGREFASTASQPSLGGARRLVYEARVRNAPRPVRPESFERLSDPAVLHDHLHRIDANVDVDPSAAIASSKELVESVCRLILDDYGVVSGAGDGINDLYRKVADALGLKAESVPGNARGSQSAQLALRGLVTTGQALAELRNELGLGHGRSVRSAALARHARLAAGAARAIAEFLLETWHVRRDA
jgi:hypothetical protein